MGIRCLNTKDCSVYKTFIDLSKEMEKDLGKGIDVIQKKEGGIYHCLASEGLESYRTTFIILKSENDEERRELDKCTQLLKELGRDLGTTCQNIELLNLLGDINNTLKKGGRLSFDNKK